MAIQLGNQYELKCYIWQTFDLFKTKLSFLNQEIIIIQSKFNLQMSYPMQNPQNKNQQPMYYQNQAALAQGPSQRSGTLYPQGNMPHMPTPQGYPPQKVQVAASQPQSHQLQSIYGVGPQSRVTDSVAPLHSMTTKASSGNFQGHQHYGGEYQSFPKTGGQHEHDMAAPARNSLLPQGASQQQMAPYPQQNPEQHTGVGRCPYPGVNQALAIATGSSVKVTINDEIREKFKKKYEQHMEQLRPFMKQQFDFKEQANNYDLEFLKKANCQEDYVNSANQLLHKLIDKLAQLRGSMAEQPSHSKISFEECQRVYNIVQGYLPALKIANQNLNIQVNDLTRRAADVQISEEIEQRLTIEMNSKKNDLVYISRIITEASRDLMILLDKYELEKCLASLRRCIDFCQKNQAVREASEFLHRTQQQQVGLKRPYEAMTQDGQGRIHANYNYGTTNGIEPNPKRIRPNEIPLIPDIQKRSTHYTTSESAAILTNAVGFGGQPSQKGMPQGHDSHNMNSQSKLNVSMNPSHLAYQHSDSTNTQPKKKNGMTFGQLFEELEKLKPSLEPTPFQTFEDLKKNHVSLDKAILQSRREQLRRDRVSDFLGQILINTTAHFDQMSTSVSSEGMQPTMISSHVSAFKKSAASIYAERAAEFERNAEIELQRVALNEDMPSQEEPVPVAQGGFEEHQYILIE